MTSFELFPEEVEAYVEAGILTLPLPDQNFNNSETVIADIDMRRVFSLLEQIALGQGAESAAALAMAGAGELDE